jgi:hypothetical protein
MAAGHASTPHLVAWLKQAIAHGLSPRHVPRFVVKVDEMAVTINGKKVETAVKAAISGRAVPVSSTVANPECLRGYRKNGLGTRGRGRRSCKGLLSPFQGRGGEEEDWLGACRDQEVSWHGLYWMLYMGGFLGQECKSHLQGSFSIFMDENNKMLLSTIRETRAKRPC